MGGEDYRSDLERGGESTSSEEGRSCRDAQKAPLAEAPWSLHGRVHGVARLALGDVARIRAGRLADWPHYTRFTSFPVLCYVHASWPEIGALGVELRDE
jgi:hypothetical protein